MGPEEFRKGNFYSNLENSGAIFHPLSSLYFLFGLSHAAVKRTNAAIDLTAELNGMSQDGLDAVVAKLMVRELNDAYITRRKGTTH